MRYETKGTILPVLDITLSAGESVFTESGGMTWMVGDITMATSTRGGLMKGLVRSMSGESIMMTTYRCEGAEGVVTFAPEAPGSVVVVELAEGESRICQKDAFMVAEESVKLESHFRKKLGAGLFGGEGFILQKLTGPGIAFVEITGDVIVRDLQAGETIKVDPGHLAMYEPSVGYDIERVKGVKNILFGGEGLFLATMTGPGKVWLQSFTIANLASKIAKSLPKQQAQT